MQKNSGEVLKIAMQARNVERKDAEEYFNRDRTTILRTLTGDNHNISTMRKWAEWLDFELWEMFALAEGKIKVKRKKP